MTLYKCSNCMSERTLDHHGHDGPICPDCSVETMTEMTTVECWECGSNSFSIRQRAQGESITGADPTLECHNCGWTARVDDDGIWA